jgi:hypothetical protein
MIRSRKINYERQAAYECTNYLLLFLRKKLICGGDGRHVARAG